MHVWEEKEMEKREKMCSIVCGSWGEGKKGDRKKRDKCLWLRSKKKGKGIIRGRGGSAKTCKNRHESFKREKGRKCQTSKQNAKFSHHLPVPRTSINSLI